ncbi:MAG: hypothetical protein WBY53_12110 [Acidobacteriaceae bacterium]
MQAMKLSPRGSRITIAFAVAVAVGALLVIKFAHHPTVWIVAMTASIPLYAAVAGAYFTNDDGDGS